ncbi:MAG: hypothetical protein JWQ93_38 [Marmoricola sp.]|nr:hypothetical protein [Marmoricola sp.]
MGQSPARGAPERLLEHWRWRPDWTPDRIGLWWYLTFTDLPQVAATSREVTAALAGSPEVDVSPPSWLHLTLREVGFEDEVSPEAVEDCVIRTRRALAARLPFVLRVDAVGMLPGAVVLWVEPQDAVQDLRDQVAGREIAPADREGLLGPFARPHISVAYVRRDGDPGPVQDLLPSPTPVQVPVSQVTLAAVTRRDQHYRWTVHTQVPIGASTVPPPGGPGRG